MGRDATEKYKAENELLQVGGQWGLGVQGISKRSLWPWALGKFCPHSWLGLLTRTLGGQRRFDALGPNCWVAFPEMKSVTLFIPSSSLSG